MGVAWVEDRLDRVDRAGPDVTENHAQCSDHHGQAQGLRAGFGFCLHVKIIAEDALVRGASELQVTAGFRRADQMDPESLVTTGGGDHGVMADAELDELYAAKPEDFTALRTKLAGAAKKGGDADAAKRISAARKPTTAAWVVNRLALGDKQVKQRLADLGERLRAAHAEMDGERIRELSTEQRRLVDELARTGFEEAALTGPPAAVRDDVTGTLQAAIADPDVAARLGRLAKAERWSGFGEFGDTAMVFTATRGAKPKPSKPVKDEPRDDKRAQAHAALAAAERTKAEADDSLSELQADLATARLRQQDARRRLQDAERGLAAAEDAYAKAKQASRDAASLVKEAKATLRATTK